MDGNIKWAPIPGALVIGIGHKARQGKDVVAKYLVDNYGAERFSFGDGLYDVARSIFGMTEKDASLLQALGTDVGRRNDPDKWVRTLYWKLKDRSPKLVVIPDVRFPNEIEMVKQMGGLAVEINRMNEDGSQFISDDRPADHPSEISLDDYTEWDLLVYAKTGRLDILENAVDSLMQPMWDLGSHSFNRLYFRK